LSTAESLPLATENVVSLQSLETEKRINKVCGYLEQNFTTKITLGEVASLISLSESNFCKFFKKATGKTFSDYLNDIRIQESCQILLKTDLDINQIAMQCGYESLSYFNRIFLKKKGLTPRQFRQSNLL
jgi:AraC-like DNA-binding protein